MLRKFFKSWFLNNRDEHLIDIVKGASVAFFLKVIGTALSFVFNILLARQFGASGSGAYFLALTVTTIAASIGRFGLENTLVRYVSAHASKNEWHLVKGIYNKSILISCILSFIISTLIFLFASFLSVDVFEKPDIYPYIRLMSFAVIPLALMILHAEALKGLKRIKDSQLLQGTILPLLLCIALIVVGDKFNLFGVVSVYVVVSYIVLFYAVYLWKRAISCDLCLADNFPINKILDSCTPLFISQITYLLMRSFSTFTLGVWGTTSEVGVFNVALRTATLLSFVLISINSIVAPKMSACYVANELGNLIALARKSTNIITVCAIPIVVVLVVGNNFVMGVFGAEFAEGGIYLVILTISQFINVCSGSSGYLLMMIGHEHLLRNNTIFVGILTLALNFLLVPKFGILGAVISTSISIAAINLGTLYLVRRELGVWILPFCQMR